MPAASILVVDDEPDIRELVKDILEDEGFDVTLAASGAEAREARGQHAPDLILLDVWMPDVDGVSLLREWRDTDTLGCPVIMISGHGTVETAVEATRLGAWDFIEKPLSLAKLLVTVNNALEAGQLRRENAGLKRQLPPVFEPLGRSPAVQLLRRRLERVAAHSANVLISGEPGVGKEQAARWLHAHSTRSQGPFVMAATRAVQHGWRRQLLGDDDKPGLLHEAQGGILYLDDVSQLDGQAQGDLLAVLEAGRLQPEVADSPPLDVRIVAGTRRALDDLVREQRFEEALFYQLNVLPLTIPPLRERQEDIPDLVRFYAEYFPGRDQLPYRHFSVAAQNRLRNYPWPGNLRELRNLVQRLLVLGGEDEIGLEEVEDVLAQCGPVEARDEAPALFHLPLREAREAFERDYLTHRLKSVDGSVGKLAEVVGMERTHLYRKLRQLGIDPKQTGRG